MATSLKRQTHLRLFKIYAAKMKGGGKPATRPEASHIIWSGIGGIIAISAIAGIASVTDSYILIPPFGATVALTFAVYQSPLAQPRNIVGGHLLTALIGLIFYTLFGMEWWSLALASGLAISIMLLTRTVHPPAGANAILVGLIDADWWFLLQPIAAGTVLLVVCAVVFNNLIPVRRYPHRWF